MKITSDQRRQYNRFTSDGTRKALTVVNPDKDGLQRFFARGDEWQDYVVAGIERFTAKMPNYNLAKIILGKDFISPEAITKTRGLSYTKEQLVAFGDTLPAQEMLEWCRDNGMMLVAGPPKSMSLLDVRSVKVDYFYSEQIGWYTESIEKFARTNKVETVWIAFRKEPVANSFYKNWLEQSKLVEAPMVVPNAAETVWGLTVYKAVWGKPPVPNLYMRTSCRDSSGQCVAVGYFGNEGIYVGSGGNSECRFDLGVASARKF